MSSAPKRPLFASAKNASQFASARHSNQQNAPISPFAQHAASSSPLSVHYSNILSRKESIQTLPSLRYRAPLKILQSHLSTLRRPNHYFEKWFTNRTGELKNDVNVQSVWPANYFENVGNTLNVPTLQHDLDSVLTTGKVHVLNNFKDPSISYFDEFLKDVAQPEHVDYNKMSGFMPPSQDKFLHNLAKYADCTFSASTSSMTSALSAFYLILSNYKAPYAAALPSFIHNTKFSTFTQTVTDKPRFLMLRPQHDFEVPGQVLTPKKNLPGAARKMVYAVDSDSLPFVPVNLILTKLGHSLERALTYNPQEFSERFIREAAMGEWEEEDDQAFHFTKFDDFIVRSQLDCFDSNLRGGRGGIFDLKTRATAPIRFNMKTYDKFIERQHITNFVGAENSFEKEFHDMVKNAFLKYSLQGLLGRMDGMFMAYHNTSQMFGFEYLPLEEINTYVYGSDFMARKALLYTMQLMSRVCNLVVDRIPNQPVRLVIRPFQNKELKTCEVLVYAHAVGADQGWKEVSDEEIHLQQFFEDPNPFNIPDNVIGFRVGTHVSRNGRPVHYELNYTEMDDVKVDYFIEELSNANNSLTADVIRMMKTEVMSGAPGEAALKLAKKLREADMQAKHAERPVAVDRL